ncbi:MAG: hypothetical protein FWG27_06595 [Treponema sp.]|nr:hypothetical protein [Treponema sp.]
MKKRFFALILACVGFLSLEAATVSVQVVETGLPFGSGCSSSAMIWESGMMDAFFDAGHIVSNAPCQQIEKTASLLPPELNGDFDEARIGGADYYVLILINYSNGSPEHPKDVFVRVFKVSTGEILYETSEAAKVWRNIDDEFLDAKKTAGNVIPRLKG